MGNTNVRGTYVRGLDTGTIYLTLWPHGYAVIEGRGVFTGRNGHVVSDREVHRGKGVEPIPSKAEKGRQYIDLLINRIAIASPSDRLYERPMNWEEADALIAYVKRLQRN